MKLFQKFIVVVKRELNHFGMSNFGNLDDQEIIALLLNLKTKMVHPFPYIIKESPEIIAKLSSLEIKHKAAYEEIKQKIKNGDDINPFLSKDAIDPNFQDYLLLDWNIHHLHLNNINLGNFFNVRGDYLLMVLFKNSVAHFIDIERHKDVDVFVKIEYLKIIKNSWPDIIEAYELKEVMAMPIISTNKEIKKFRKNQINTCLKIDDKVYAPIGGGITLAGTGTNHILKSIKLKKQIDSLEAKYQATKISVLEDIFKKTGKSFPDLDLDFNYHQNQLELIDKNSNLIIESMNF